MMVIDGSDVLIRNYIPDLYDLELYRRHPLNCVLLFLFPGSQMVPFIHITPNFPDLFLFPSVFLSIHTHTHTCVLCYDIIY